MYPSVANDQKSPYAGKLSPCSQQRVKANIEASGSCLKSPNPCQFGGTCCTNVLGSLKSPGTQCRAADSLLPCQLEAQCDGVHAECPANTNKDDGTRSFPGGVHLNHVGKCPLTHTHTHTHTHPLLPSLPPTPPTNTDTAFPPLLLAPLPPPRPLLRVAGHGPKQPRRVRGGRVLGPALGLLRDLRVGHQVGARCRGVRRPRLRVRARVHVEQQVPDRVGHEPVRPEGQRHRG